MRATLEASPIQQALLSITSEGLVERQEERVSIIELHGLIPRTVAELRARLEIVKKHGLYVDKVLEEPWSKSLRISRTYRDRLGKRGVYVHEWISHALLTCQL